LEPVDNPGVTLAHRLKELRVQSFDKPITQGVLAQALGVTAQSVSSWEREDKVTVIPVGHLRAYARFFAVDRLSGDGRRQLLEVSDMTDDQRRRAVELEFELDHLRKAALGESGIRTRDAPAAPAEFPGLRDPFWRFPNDRDITIVCAELPPDQIPPSPLTDPNDPDFVGTYVYSDLGAVLEIYGHLRAVNPNSNIKIRPARSGLICDDYTDHLVLLGGVDFNHVTQAVLDLVDLPITQESRSTPDDPGMFRVDSGEGGGGEFRPEIIKSRDGGRRTLLRDVAHFYRGPNPYNKLRTVTICNGMFGRGVEGAVRAMTDPKFRDRNAEYIRTRLENWGSVSLLFWVSITGSGPPLPPDWTQVGTVLYESPAF
jgi:DNA-binding XRE family transcriptional regulator